MMEVMRQPEPMRPMATRIGMPHWRMYRVQVPRPTKCSAPDFHFIKKSADTMERMGPIAWRLTSKTTGESHVIVSDKNGELHTKSCDGRFNDSGTGTTGCRPHSRNTNANDPDAVNANGAVGKDSQGNPVVKDASKLDAEAGIWFTGIGPRSGGQSVQWTSATSYEVTRDGAKRAVQVNDALRRIAL